MKGPPKPHLLKVISGTDRKDRSSPVVKLPLLERAPDPPDWLPNAHAVKEWNYLVPILVRNRMVTEGSLGPLGMLCSLHGKIVQLYAAGEAPTGHMLAQYRGLANDFGLTPMSQGRIKPGESSGKANPFGQFKDPS